MHWHLCPTRGLSSRPATTPPRGITHCVARRSTKPWEWPLTSVVLETVIGIVLLALGMSLAEFTVTVVALNWGKTNLALDIVLGSTRFKLLGILGVAAVVGASR